MMTLRFRGETDITTVFGTVVPGSSPGGSTYVKTPHWGGLTYVLPRK